MSSPQNVPLLRLRGAGFRYCKGPWLFRNVDLDLYAGESLVILGPNGVGKSTLLQSALGLLPLSEGVSELSGDDAARLPPGERARRVAHLPQAEADRLAYTVREYLLMGRAPYIGTFSTPRAGDRDRVAEVMAQLDLEHLASRPIDQISGGERRRVGIARVLVQGAPALVLDEPTAALDLTQQVRVLRRIHDLTEQGLGILHTTHDPDHALLLGGRVALLEPGAGVRLGTAREMLTTETLTRVFQVPLRVSEDAGLGRPSCSIVGLQARSP